ncbi:hypothetical protein TrVE_jg1226 [Triparma verrucosa]|uniref:Nudix hydrolase domain-containing protein n=1 Tax=Triparma verrucosa TaxID=1606542 RepID=A0A9W7FBP0_9STRA|nr:hypothetical protein TrVE_jg1226 [Triparma verrucosa]
MWVFPGGHSDYVNNKFEGLRNTAGREFREEIGGDTVIDDEPLCVYQASLFSRGLTYLITFYTSTIPKIYHTFSPSEITRIAWVPKSFILQGGLRPHIYTGMSLRDELELAEGVGVVEGSEYVGGECRRCEVDLREIVGGGGEGEGGGGIGMAHRFALECWAKRVEEEEKIK